MLAARDNWEPFAQLRLLSHWEAIVGVCAKSNSSIGSALPPAADKRPSSLAGVLRGVDQTSGSQPGETSPQRRSSWSSSSSQQRARGISQAASPSASDSSFSCSVASTRATSWSNLSVRACPSA
eukprot:CAMPEP_0115283488 /NCGR_PEP_ID=MMETSP0270-20121206/60404_1 /TAXON_ID=71861 /ORGANISM="Scrippsiella trochoidea, Strain CCMP3099" /LENGTH=123 /DNA_ID=CAMNT_0002700407 /DNA_START=126 /DNA_END=494 /DNA_ORIENTATION=-